MEKNMLLANKTAIVTGASRGIGKAIALLFAEQGADVVVTGSTEKTIRETAEGIRAATGRICEPVWGDIADPETAAALVEAALRINGRVDVLVNNAGAITRTSTEQMTFEEWNTVLAVNLNGPLFCCKAVIPRMRSQGGGRIVNISSGAGKKPHPNAAPSYGVSKAGLIALTKHLALELAACGIRVNAVCPGPIKTAMSDQWSDEYRKKTIATIPLGKMGEPADVAGAALFLASDLSNFITGESINVNGGTLMD